MPRRKTRNTKQEPEDKSGPSNSNSEASTSSERAVNDKPSSSRVIPPSRFYSSEKKGIEPKQMPEKPGKQHIQRVARIDEDIFGFDDTSSSDSNITVDSTFRERQIMLAPDENDESVDVEESDDDTDNDDVYTLYSMDSDNLVLVDDLMEEDPFEFTDGTDDDDDEDDDDSGPFGMSIELLSDVPEEDTSDDDSDLPDDPFEREILGSIVEPTKSLHLAVVKGDTKTLARWQVWGSGVWARKVKGDTELHCAARSGDVATVEQLIKSGAELNTTNKKMHTPLEVAALSGHAAVVRTLLKHGAGSDTLQMEHALLATKSSAVVEALAEEDDSFFFGAAGVDVLSRAVRDGRVLLVQALLKGGADANWPGAFSRTALHTAASRGHVRCMTTLLENNADVTCVDDRLWTPLHYASFHNHRECVQVLLAAGADPNVKSGEGQLPYDVAFDEPIHRLLENA